jgi:hypothetical protein
LKPNVPGDHLQIGGMPPFEKLAAQLVANYPQMPLFVKLAALLVANYPQMSPCMKSGTMCYCMFSANFAITDIDKISMPLQIPQLLLNIATKPLHPR